MFYVHSETILNNNLFFLLIWRRVIHTKGKSHLAITYLSKHKLRLIFQIVTVYLHG